MEKDLRASLVAAGAAAALSALVGIIAGVGFFILFLRALVGGLLVGAVTYAGIQLLRRSVPGIVEGSAPGAVETGSEIVDIPPMGANVDIVLQGEEDEPTPLLAEAEPFVAKPIAEDDEEAGFLEEASLLEPEEAESVAQTAIPEGGAERRERRASLGFDELDVLPDLDGFTGAFTASEFAFGASQAERPDRGSSSPGGASTGSRGGSSAPRSGQDGSDPAMLAQAVRTILKRDQKG